MHTKEGKESSSPCRAQSRETVLGQVGDHQHIASPGLSNNLVHSVFINNRGLPLQGEIYKKSNNNVKFLCKPQNENAREYQINFTLICRIFLHSATYRHLPTRGELGCCTIRRSSPTRSATRAQRLGCYPSR